MEDVLKLLVVAVTYPLWWPILREIWVTVDPYPGILTERDLHGDADSGRDLEPLQSEEWSVWRRRRAARADEPEAALPRRAPARPGALVQRGPARRGFRR